VTRRGRAHRGRARPSSTGPNGIDNAFGAKLIPALTSQLRTFAIPSAGLTGANERGEGTFLFDVVGLSDDETQSADGLRIDFLTTGLGGSAAGGVPAWDGRDDWAVLDASLVNGTLTSGGKVRFGSGYVAAGTIVSGAPTNFAFTLRLRGTVNGAANFDLPFKVRSGFITARHTPPRAGQPRRLDAGLIVGRIRRDDILQTLDGALASARQCAIAPAVAELMNAMYDLLPPGTPASAACDELSFAIGFDAVEAMLPSRVEPASGGPSATCSTP
jgi:hypothetical protein